MSVLPQNKELKFQAASHEPVRAELWNRIYSRLRPYWKEVALALILVSIASATQPLLAIIMKPLLDDGFTGGKPYYIWFLPLSVIGLMLLRGVTTYLSTYVFAWVTNKMLFSLRAEMFQRLLNLPDEEFRRGDTGRLLNRFTIDAGVMTGVATEVVTVVTREVLTVIALLGVLLYMSWQLTIIVFLVMPISVFVARMVSRRLRRINRDTINMNAELTRVVNEAIDGQRVIKLFNGYEREQERFSYVNARLRRFAMRAAAADAALSPITQLFVAVAVAGVIFVALYQANTGALTIGSFAAFMAALGQIFDPIKRLTNMTGTVQRMLVSAESVFRLVDQEAEQDLAGGDLDKPVRGRVEFVNVSHQYPNTAHRTLNNVSFVVEPGQTVALVGRSGSGKTTLANMLPRFVQGESGQVLLDDTDIQTLSLRNLRSQISLVSQDVVLFEGSIGQNVAYGAEGAVSEEEIWFALEAASLDQFVKSLPQGLETQVGENASALSGGQRQRLAIARALIKNSPVLILDEATSALDNESERQVQVSLEALMQGRSTIVIAHRLSTVQKADMILVLDQGEIIERGRHDELLKLDGVYANLYRLQFANSEVA
ncbi:lipid A export permease/ATP-binding protein MsbA [Alcaligenes endophyticus]|uniref:lipid A export permease/ATP-binding protein MsbA n=1 Tax=Alcaligenes endophyticus TaxID=1929088 RepID=UPI00361EF47B